MAERYGSQLDEQGVTDETANNQSVCPSTVKLAILRLIAGLYLLQHYLQAQCRIGFDLKNG